MQMQDIPDPTPAPGEVIVRVAAAGICGSELEGFASQSPMRVPPLVMGHEFAGIRESDGARVVVNPLLTCGTCDLCTHGLVNLCRERQLIGVHRAGGFAERVAVPAGQCVEIPDDITLEQAVMIEPLANAVHALRIAHDDAWPAERIGVIGAGALGLAVVVAARGLPAVQTLEVVDLMTERLDIVRAAGASSAGAQLSTDLSVPGVVVETLDAADEVRAAVGTLALAAAGSTSQGRSAARAALGRLDVHAVETVSVEAVTGAVDALVRAPRAAAAESLTVLGRDAPDGELLDALVAHLATHHPAVEATMVGPTGHGPALVLGLD